MFRLLNQDSQQRIKNIVNQLRSIPAFAAYEINSYMYNPLGGVQAIEVSKDGKMENLYLFFPGVIGEIDSIALYGSDLANHYYTMKNSMQIFGMKIYSITMDYGQSDYLDIEIEN